jgi:hypothetical protein
VAGAILLGRLRPAGRVEIVMSASIPRKKAPLRQRGGASGFLPILAIWYLLGNCVRQSGGLIDLKKSPSGDIIVVIVRICVPKSFWHAIGSISRTFLPKFVSFWRAGLNRLMIKIKAARRRLTDFESVGSHTISNPQTRRTL